MFINRDLFFFVKNGIVICNSGRLNLVLNFDEIITLFSSLSSPNCFQHKRLGLNKTINKIAHANMIEIQLKCLKLIQ